MLEENNNQAVESQEVQQESSVKSDVTTESSTVNTQVASPESVSQVKQTTPVERSIPYSRFKESLSQRDNFKSELQKAQETNQKLMQMLEGFNPNKQQAIQNPEQEQAAQQLMDILSRQPQFKGLMDKLAQLEEKTGSFTSSQVESALDKEQDAILKRCSEFGLNPSEVFGQTDEEGNVIVKGEIQRYIESHPVLSKIGIAPGVPEMAFRALYFDKQMELADKRANLKLINEQQAKKKGLTQPPGSTSKGSKPKESMEEFLSRRIEEEGGLGT